MDIAFLVDPLESLKGYKDSSVAMMREAQARGHRVFAFLQDDLRWAGGEVSARATHLELHDRDDDWYRVTDSSEQPLSRFDVVMMRKDPPFDMEYVYATYLLELAGRAGTRVYNRPGALRDFNEKLSIARFPEFTAPTLVTRQEDDIRAFLADQREIVLKPLDGMGGASVFRVGEGDPNVGVIIETLTEHGTRTVMAQRYLPAIRQGDKRVLLIDGRPAPYALARIPKAGETRGNLAAGGRGVAQPLSDRDREIAESVGARLRGEGLLIVGLDVIGDCLTEVNVTSPTCMREILDQTGFSVPGMVLDALERD
ncbi:MAG: glutathione synthase [Betaproteobacteria bacterium]|nr:glutathione synthase [Betaproteobacteria bacterium]